MAESPAPQRPVPGLVANSTSQSEVKEKSGSFEWCLQELFPRFLLYPYCWVYNSTLFQFLTVWPSYVWGAQKYRLCLGSDLLRVSSKTILAYFPATRLFILVEFIIQFYPTLNVRSTVKENQFTIYNEYNQGCSSNIYNNYVSISLLFQVYSIYIASYLSYIQHSMLCYTYMKRRYIYPLGL